MIHIFTIHSHITMLAAVGTVQLEALDVGSVVFICSEGYKPPLSSAFSVRLVNSLDQIEKSLGFIKRVRQINYCNAADCFIRDVVSTDSFTAYIDTMSGFNRYLVMHPLCRGFHIIEEGLVNYADYDNFRLLTADMVKFSWHWSGLKHWREMLNGFIRLLRGRSIRMQALPIHPNIYTLHRGVLAYCFSEYAFRFTPKEKKKILSWASIAPLLDETGPVFPPGSWFWISDMLATHFGVSSQHIVQALDLLLCEINPGKKPQKIFLRFRGGEPDAERRVIVEKLKYHNFYVEILEQPLVMEMVFLKGQGFTVCGNISSLLLYARLMGHKTYSMFRFIPDIYKFDLAKDYSTIGSIVGYTA